ncbi:MAG: hypothetical protein SNJ77_06620, partial [Cytophagales bacterium]
LCLTVSCACANFAYLTTIPLISFIAFHIEYNGFGLCVRAGFASLTFNSEHKTVNLHKGLIRTLNFNFTRHR